ncbi:MAG TPA: flippase-like domain-containing protein [Chloroflexi bacterium]|nr:flippase-like domain-containing protein [Chloroflexota bacterium]
MRQWRFWVGVVVSLVCLILVLRNVDYREVISALRQADYLWLIPASIPLAATIASKVLRWQLLFPDHHPRVRRTNLLSALMISYALNTILPARLGEVARAYVIGQSENLSKSLAFSTIVVEKVLDVLTLLLFLVLLVPTVTLPPWIQQSAMVMAPVFLALFVLVLALAYQRRRTLALVQAVAGRLRGLPTQRLVSSLDSALSGFDALGSLKANLVLWGWSIAVWVTSGLFILVMMLAFHIDAPLSAAFLLLCVTSLGMTVPSSPGYIGVYHWLVVSTLYIFGVNRELALSFAFALHALTFLPLTLIGIYFMMRENYSLQRIEEGALTGHGVSD